MSSTLTGDLPDVRTVVAAQQLGISAKKLRDMVKKGEIKAIRRPGRNQPWTFEQAELARWREKNSFSGINPRRRR